MTLFEKYGGVQSVRKIVNDFYGIVLANARTKTFFQAVDTPQLIEHQINFICFLMGRPAKVMPDQLLKNAHSGRRIPESAFNEVATILQNVLEKNGMETADVETIIQIVASHKNSIVELPTFTRTHTQ
jgi:hemoglobin